MDGLSVCVSSEGGYAAQVVDAAKKIRCAVMQMQMAALHLHGYCIAENAALGHFLHIHLVASEVPRPGRGYEQWVSRMCKCAHICHPDSR